MLRTFAFLLVLLWACWCYGQNSSLLQDRLEQEDAAELAADAVRFGDPLVGAAIFRQAEMNCATCHLPHSQRRLGPDLAEQRDVTALHLVESLLFPSKTIREGYETTLLLTVDGKSISGVLVKEDDQELVLDQIEQSKTPLRINKEDIDDRRKSKKSTMPEGLVNQLADRQQFLNLVCYLHEISVGGKARDIELSPAESLFALPPLPGYESDINHRQYVSTFDDRAFERGQEIYRLRCESCHGTVAEPGSLPTSLRFANGKFKHGSDPHTMYQTLTHGYGMMNPQRWMVPQQKYDVIHFIREHFLSEHNRDQYFELSASYLDGLPAGSSMGPAPVKYTPWTAMDYGPSLNNTIEVSDDTSNIAQKGIAVRLDSGPGGVASGNHWMLYDHDLMRVAAVWNGEFIDYNGIHFNGVHGRHPRIAGQKMFNNPLIPGWGMPATGSFEDQRLIGRDGRRYGPLTRDWLRYKGMYRFGNQTILSYRIGNTAILESPSLSFAGEMPVVSRNFEIGSRNRDLILQVANVEVESQSNSLKEHLLVFNSTNDTSTRPAGREKTSLMGGRFLQSKRRINTDLFDRNFCIVAEIKADSDGTIVAQTLDQPDWIPDGKTFFIRDGRLHFDIGWVSVVASKMKVRSEKWTKVAMNWNANSRRVDFYANGKYERCGRISPNEKLRDSVLRIGFTNEDFPSPSHLPGHVRDVKVFDRCLSAEELRNIESLEDQPAISWDASQLDGDSNFTWRDTNADSPATSPENLLVFTSLDTRHFDWIREDGNLRLRIKKGDEDLRFSVSFASSPEPFDASEQLAGAISSATPKRDLKRLTAGGPPNWPTKLTTQATIDKRPGPFQVDVLTRPETNPWDDRLRFSGLDFVEGGKVAIICCWDGSVYRVEGLASENGQLIWQRIAAGLFQPLGVKIVDDQLYVCCRDQIVRLHDLNGDREIDFYENFNSDHQVTEHFHEFAMGLQTDEKGNFYYAKSARHALKAVVPHHGTLLKVDPQGDSTTIVANGFRAANGVCLNEDGSFIVTDQEGHWNPKNRINWVREGGFYGNMFGYHEVEDDSDDAMEKPMCWITNAFDRSPAELLWVDSEIWGPLNGSLLNFSYGHGKVYIVPHENVDGQMQGGMCALPIPDFPTGIMRGRFNALDGQLYGCGMFAWSSNRQQPGGFYRIRYTGAPVHLPIGISASSGQIKIAFSDQLDRASVVDVGNYKIATWDLKRSANYGSKHFNEKQLQIQSATLHKDGRTVLLSIKGLAPTRGMSIDYSLKNSQGKRVRGKIHNTIHKLAK